jgi:hypothetical protein
MELQWFDSTESKLHVKLAENEALGSLKGPGQFQILRNSAEFGAIEEMDPQPEIADAPGVDEIQGQRIAMGRAHAGGGAGAGASSKEKGSEDDDDDAKHGKHK